MPSVIACEDAEGVDVCPAITQPREARRGPADRRAPFVDPRSAAPASMSRRTERFVKAGILLAAAAAFALALATGKLQLRYSLLPDSRLDDLFWLTALLYGGFMYGVMVWRVVLWRRYRPMESVSDAELPSVCVIIPAFNEGPLVQQSILSVAASRYPKDRLEIIAIDDGSADDTWLHIRAAAARVDPRIRMTTLRQPTNQGKREALYLGFQKGTADVFVTIDSDSILHPEALRNGVTPLVREPALGCVAGCVEVLNPRQSLITRFLRTTFSLSFKFVRAYQSEFRGVFCTPGALSVYRADVVRKVADEWVRQKFLGLPCTTGEDRAMTNLILREGRLSCYQQNAVVYSKMPHTYTGMVKMLLRWGRSNIRETIFLFRFLFTRFRTRYLQTFRFNMLLTALTLVLPPFMILNSYLLLLTSSGYLVHQLGMLVLYAVTMSVIYYANERDSDWTWLFVYEFLWPVAFAWIIPWASLTLRNTGWLTRGVPAGRAADRGDEVAGAILPLPRGSGLLEGIPRREPAMAIAGT
jgi:hyaluronan synthase